MAGNSRAAGVSVTAFQAFHSNGIPPSLLGAPGVAPGTTGYGGNDGGVIIEFTNGLHVYLTGDTGPTVDMKFVVKDLYDANLVVANIGGTNTMSPSVAAYAINEWLRPATVIPTHINQGSTSAGIPTGKLLLEFLAQVDRKTAVEIPLSGVTMEFNGRGCRVNK
jgi:L-ascorbate metabolism protein UlaG (beta-lactamase superfamily)